MWNMDALREAMWLGTVTGRRERDDSSGLHF